MEYVKGLLNKIGDIVILFLEKMGIKDRPIILFVIIAILVAAFIIYDRDNENPKILSSLTRSFRKLIILVADLTSDIISLFSSLAEIINLIRILIFGKVDSQTQIYLANYAIIFMSIVSYFTTMSGLSEVLNEWQAILASFGVQVGILVFSGRLAKITSGFWNNDVEKNYIYRLQCKIKSQKCVQCNDCTQSVSLKNNINSLPQQNNKKKKIIEGVIVTFALVILMACSSFFSYNAFWQKFVLPSADWIEYTNAKLSVAEIEETYSKELRTYQKNLEEILYEFNNIILINYNTSEFANIESKIENINNEILVIDEQIITKKEEQKEYEIGSYEWQIIGDEIDALNDDIQTKKIDIENVESEKSEPGYVIYYSLNYLTSFYANPLTEDMDITSVQNQWGRLWNALLHVTKTKDLFTMEQKTNLDIVFNNYLELCQYYKDNGVIGFKTNENQVEVGSSDVDYKENTKILLETAIMSLEHIPNFEPVNAVWEDRLIGGTSKILLLEQLYADYRDCGDDVEMTEKAIRELVSVAFGGLFGEKSTLVDKRSGWMTIFVVLLAFLIDFTIVLVTIWKGNKNVNRSISELRRLVGILFINKEGERGEEERRMQLSVAFGLLFGVLMFVVQQLLPKGNVTEENLLYWLFFLYCACGLLIAIIMGKAIGRAQKVSKTPIDDDENKSKDDSARVGAYLFEEVKELFTMVEWKVICIVNTQNQKLENEKRETCIKTKSVKDKKWDIEFSMLESYKLVSLSDDGEYYIIKEMFWKLLYMNVLDKMAGNQMVPLSVEDLINYDDTEGNGN